ncbi:MAG: phosphocholine cytidylyltransferase family protein [Wenzhouxiangellaceae bacterium]|nr:phosphocholine cytidylyltransferase family protein [Wenzhouxiangellaceae bacterium]
MNVIILAAGAGTRLRPHTSKLPKCMVELAGRPILHRQLEVLCRNGMESITLVAGYRADAIEAGDAAVMVNPFHEECNMVASLFHAASAMKNEQDLLVSYGDIVYEDSVLRALLECPGEIAVAADIDWRTLWQARMDNPLEDAESFRMSEGNRIVELGEKLGCQSDAQAQFMGLIRVRADRVAEFKEAYRAMDRHASYRGRPFRHMYMTDFLQHLIDAGWDLRAALVRNGWLEVDTVEDLNRYHALAREKRLDALIQLDH